MKDISAYRRDVLEVQEFLLERRFKKAADALKETLTQKKATQLISAGYSVQAERMASPGAGSMTYFRRSRLERCLSHEQLAEEVTTEWGKETERIHKEQSDQAKKEWFATLRPDQLFDAKVRNILPPEIKRLPVRRFAASDIAKLESGNTSREQTDPSWIQPFEHFFGAIWEDLCKREVTVKQDIVQSREKMASIGAYRRDVLEVVDVLLKRKQAETAKTLLSLPDAIQQQILGAAFSLQAHRARYGTGGRVCLMRQRRIELGLTTDEMAKKIEDYYRKHSSQVFAQIRAEFIAKWIEKVKPHPVEIRAVQQGSMIPPGMPRQMVILPITGADVSRLETDRPHRETTNEEVIRPFEFYWNEVWEDLMKLVPILTRQSEKAQATTEKQENVAEAPAKVKARKAQANGKPAPSQSSLIPPAVVPPDTTITPEVAANGG